MMDIALFSIFSHEYLSTCFLWIYYSIVLGKYLEMELLSHRLWHPTPALLPGKSHGRRSLVGRSPWVAKCRTRLSDFTFTFHFHALEKEMATHSSVLAWRIPGTGEPCGLPYMGLHRVGQDWSNLAAAADADVTMREVLLSPVRRGGKTKHRKVVTCPRWHTS